MSINKLNFLQKQNGDILEASEWNQTVGKIDELVEASNNGGNNGGGNGGVVSVTDDTVSDPSAGVNVATGVTNVGTIKVMELTKKKKGVNTTLISLNNINIEPRESVDDTKGGNISFKPGDDIEFCSHHRLAANQDEVSVKIIDGNDNPVKLQLNAAEMTLTTKDKTGDDANIFDINVNSGKNTKGYLKVRAQAIDLRCEAHGGIALQPKGTDSLSHMNKIKFEHGGGDGLEFGTFNAEKTSIFTDEYRFNKDGVWKMATRIKEVSDKYDNNDETTHYKYAKAADDFYDQIDITDEQCTTRDIIQTAAALNGNPCIHAKITNSGNLEIATTTKFLLSTSTTAPDVYNQFAIDSPYPQSLPSQEAYSPVTPTLFIPGKYYSLSEVTAPIASASNSGTRYVSGNSVGNVDMAWVRSQFTNGLSDQESMTLFFEDGIYYTFTKYAAPDIKIDSGADLKLGGILDFGSSFNFGETDNGIEVQYKLTKKNAQKDCGILKVVGVNNHATNSLTIDGVTIAPGKTSTIAQCSILDIIKLVNYMKTNNLGPWAVPQ